MNSQEYHDAKLREAVDPASVSQMQYVCRLSRVILMAARQAKVIYVGRSVSRALRQLRYEISVARQL
jgi:hypothetical protein